MTKRPAPPDTPWDDLNEAGDGLTVNNFLTTRLSQLTNALRRELTTSYTEPHGLSVSEWRLLSLICHAGTIPFGTLVVQSTSDKALVSRTVRLLQDRKLIDVHPEEPGSKRKIVCAITPKGRALHERVIPKARATQAQAIRALSNSQRAALFEAVAVLQHYIDQVAQERAATTKVANGEARRTKRHASPAGTKARNP